MRALALARYNWPLYATAVLTIVAGIALSITQPALPIRLFGLFGAIVAGWFAAASLLAFHAMFDRSPLLSGRWLPELLSASPQRWIQISVCLEETTLPMERLYPDAKGALLDLFAPGVMTEPAVRRARSISKKDAVAAAPAALDVADRWADATVSMLAAHEVRDRNLREALFRELARVTAMDGRVVVVEHLRNLAAFAAFGPAYVHFFPRREWLSLADQAGLELLTESSMTPFIHVFVFARAAPQRKTKA
jgi:SAM-dependent methyltransferase